MGDQPPSRSVVVDGREPVALSAEDFARLLAIRRQVGGRSSRIGILTAAPGDPLETVETVEEIDRALTGVAATHDCEAPRLHTVRGARGSARPGTGRAGAPTGRTGGGTT